MDNVVIWKSLSDKLFRRITEEPLELIKHVQRECYAYFGANSKSSEEPCLLNQTHNAQTLCL